MGSSDLEITEDHEGQAQLVGIRFNGVEIPQGTPIQSAYIQFTTDEADKNRDPFGVTIYGEASDDAQPYSEAVGFDISNRPRTAASVVWTDVPDWTLEHETGPARPSARAM